jgi:DNA polymerase bacteriophage-type
MFSAKDLLFVDFETASAVDLKAVGTVAYATHATSRAIVLAFAVGDGPAQTWHNNGEILDWNNAPADLRAAFDAGMTLAAWNCAFDAAIWNYATVDGPFLEPERAVDVMVQALVSNLPADLQSASKALGGAGKQKDGRKLIKLFSVERAAPSDYPEKWAQFLAYARQDVEAMRDVYRRTRPLPMAEWAQYHAFERANRRGVCIDVPFVERAAALADKDSVAIGRRLDELTDGAVTKVTQAQRLANWIYDQVVDPDLRSILTTGPLEEDGSDPEFSLTRGRVDRVLAVLDAKRANGGLDAAEEKVREAAELRLFGAGAAQKKFARLAAQHVDGVLRNQYQFSGAGQTGRMSGRGVQIQNLSRDVLGEDGADEAPLVDAIADGYEHAFIAAMRPLDVPVARKLGLLVRPAIIAGHGKVFVWSDWSAIEARITPWLANSIGGEKVLDVFRENDADPSRPDIYMVAAAGILHKDPSEITKSERNIGKVATLALAFGGGVGALQSMALNYRIHLDDTEAKRIVDAWRDSNPWAKEFWGAHRDGYSFGLWGAAMTAMENPGQITTAGRVSFVYHAEYLGGSLFMGLPSGRLLTYPRPRWREVQILDKDGKPTGRARWEMSFKRAHGRAKLYHGTLAENSTQAVAADILRETVTSIETNPDLASLAIRMTCHDEIVAEVDAARAAEAEAILRAEMLTAPAWATGLPLQSEESVCEYYTKAKSALRGAKETAR